MPRSLVGIAPGRLGSNNYTADGDPEAWEIVNGKLYINYSKTVQKKWEQEVDKRIEDGVHTLLLGHYAVAAILNPGL